MRLLAVDTSTAAGSVALLDGEDVVAEFTLNSNKAHSETIMMVIDNLFNSVGVGINTVDVFAISTGPGSFTGLRVGISIIKGMAWCMNKPVIGVSTLMSLAMNIPYANGMVCPIINARKKQIYVGLYRWEDGNMKVVLEDKAMCPESLIEIVNNEVVFLGDGLDICGNLIKNSLRDSHLVPRYLWTIKASNVGRLALKKFDERVTAAEIVPIYMRGM
jgi:tRNA threonylcarbamoyladenosine biosynthesis protein TsaB